MSSTNCALGNVIMTPCYVLVCYNYMYVQNNENLSVSHTSSIIEWLMNECKCNSQPKMHNSVSESNAGSMEEQFNDRYNSCTFLGVVKSALHFTVWGDTVWEKLATLTPSYGRFVCQFTGCGMEFYHAMTRPVEALRPLRPWPDQCFVPDTRHKLLSAMHMYRYV